MTPPVNRYHPTWLVNGDGNFNPRIEQDLELAGENSPLAAVSIMGIQSTGKSTLLNKIFSTNFQEMDESQGMSQTTKGIWIAKWPSLNGGPKILVIDTEGSDGSERGREGDDTFEKKTTLFALSLSNTVIFNMKCDNVNLHHGASRPVLETVLQVMLRKFSTPRQVNLLFVLRDKNMCPLDTLRSQLIQGLSEIWQGILRTQANVNAALENYFNIELMAMSHYRYAREEFDKEVGNLRERVITLVQLGELISPASGFVALAQKNWNDIKEDKILNLQLNKITVDALICHEIADKISKNFRGDKSWLQIKRDVKSGTIVQGFGNAVSKIIGNYLSEYDEKTLDADESKRFERKKELSERMLEDVERIYLSVVENVRNATLESFQELLVQDIKKRSGELAATNRKKLIAEFNDSLQDAKIKQANWNDTNELLEKLKSEFDSYEEGARIIEALLKKLKIKRTLLWTGVAALGVTAVACTAGVAAAFMLPALAGIAGTAVAIPSTISVSIPAVSSLSVIIAGAHNAKQIERELEEARQSNPALGVLLKRLDK